MPLFLLNLLKHVFSFTIPVPVALLVAAWGFYQAAAWWDKTAAIKKAVDAAVHELITGAEKEALQERLKAERALKEAYRKISERQIENARIAHEALEEYQADAEGEIDDLKERLDELRKSNAPVIDRRQFDRLRDK